MGHTQKCYFLQRPLPGPLRGRRSFTPEADPRACPPRPISCVWDALAGRTFFVHGVSVSSTDGRTTVGVRQNLQQESPRARQARSFVVLGGRKRSGIRGVWVSRNRCPFSRGTAWIHFAGP